MLHKIFVYGTLKRGKGLNKCLANSSYICEGTLKGYDMYLLSKTVPCIMKGKGVVKGEVYNVCVEDEYYVDMIELSAGYNKVKETIHTDSGTVEAYVYSYEYLSYLKARWKKIPSGVFF